MGTPGLCPTPPSTPSPGWHGDPHCPGLGVLGQHRMGCDPAAAHPSMG